MPLHPDRLLLDAQVFGIHIIDHRQLESRAFLLPVLDAVAQDGKAFEIARRFRVIAYIAIGHAE